MSIEQPEPVDHPIEDSGIHVRDSEHAPATGWQITMVGLLIVAILCVFFYGLTNQREEVAGPQPTQQAESVPPAQTQQKPATTGQGGTPAQNAANPQGAPRQQPAQKAGDQNAAQPQTAPQSQQKQ